MPTDISAPTALAAMLYVGLLLLGLVILWRLFLTPWGRAFWRQPSALSLANYPLNEIALCVLVVIAGGVVGQIVGMYVSQTIGLKPDDQLVFQGGGFQLGMLLGVVLASGILRASAGRPLTTPTVSGGPSVVVGGAITLAAALPILVALNIPWTLGLQALGFEVERQELVDLFGRSESTVTLVAMAVLATVVAPVVEELIFRAGIFRFLLHRVPRVWAYVIPGATFGSMHANLFAFAPLFALGVILSVAYERTGRIAVPIVAHALFNLNTVLLLWAGVDL